MQRKLTYLLLALCAVTALMLTSCRKDSDSSNPADPGNPTTTTITTTIIGVINDESGKPVANAEVVLPGQTPVKTNSNGLFILRNARVPSDRCFVIATHSGYFNAARAEVPRSNAVTNMRLSMMSNAPTDNFSASSGKKISLGNGSTIDFPANAYVNAKTGSAYTGTVRVAVRHLDPTSPTFFNYFAGDFTAQRTDGSRTDLLSYGVLRVEMTGSAGEKLQLATGKTATLSYPISSSMQSGAPSEMPLWSFNEQLGMWKEEGKAVKQGSMYSGEVSHFTEWNCDYPGNTAELDGVVSCGSEPVSGVIISLGQRQAITDENGHYHQRVPAGITFEISVRAEQNMGTMMAPKTVGQYAAGAKAIEDLIVSPCPAYITGKLVDCNSAPVEGLMQAVGTNLSGYILVGPNGEFKVRVMPGTALSADAFGFNGAFTTPLPIDPVPSGETKNIGSIQLCNTNNPITYMDIDLGTAQEDYVYHLDLSPDGTRLAAIAYSGTRIYDAQDGTLLQTITSAVGNWVEFSDDGSKLLTEGFWNTPNPVNVWDVATGQNLHTFAGMRNPHFLPGGTAILAVESIGQADVVKMDIASGAEVGRYPHGKGSIQLVGSRAGGTQFVGTDFQTDFTKFRAFVWDMNANSLIKEFDLNPSGGDSTASRLSFDRNLLATPTDKELRLYNVLTGQIVNTASMTNYLLSFALAPNNTSFAGQIYGGGTYLPPAIYSVQNSAILKLLPTFNTNPSYSSFAFNSQGTRLAAYAGYKENKIRIWQLP